MSNNSKSESIVFLERNTITVDFHRPNFAHQWTEFNETSNDELVERLQDATIVICNKTHLRADTLSQLPRLKLIAIAATGTDNVDLEYCRSNHIAVINTRGYATTSLTEHALMLMLVLRRNLIAYRNDVHNGLWHQARQFCLLDHPISDLNGLTLGIIGYGKLGQAMAQLGTAIGMKPLIAERKAAANTRHGRTPFTEVLKTSDVISLHCPLTPETENLIGADELRQMKSTAILINTARGGLVNDMPLLEALRSNQIAGAALDVLRHEPPVSGNPLLEAALPNLVITPHHAWASQQAMQTLADQLVDNVEAFIRGEPRNLVV
jgi:glycerate dehydrogenase